MKKTLTILIALLLADFSIAEGLYEQLCAFNPNWKKYEKQVGDFPAGDFRSDRLYIRAHLGQVLKILDGNSISGLSEDQLSTRKRLIGLLEDYRLEGNFPKNYYRRERIPIFIDEHGTHCAVGYLMMQCGKEEMAQRISARNNYVWVKDLVDEELAGWQLSSGFTFEELKLIQGAYDSYMDGALEVAYRYEIPQKPEVMTHYFGEKELSRRDKKKVDRSEKNLWCRGEGEKGVLNGKWVQNYSAGMPWIVGYYDAGKRTGQWEEYYQGTKKLCRTEHWENDKLNGIRKRFDRKGKAP